MTAYAFPPTEHGLEHLATTFADGQANRARIAVSVFVARRSGLGLPAQAAAAGRRCYLSAFCTCRPEHLAARLGRSLLEVNTADADLLDAGLMREAAL